MKRLSGVAASPGIGIGPAYMLTDEVEPILGGIEDPAAAFEDAAATAAEQITALAKRAESEGLAEAAEILGAQALMAADPMLADEVKQRLAGGMDLDAALAAAEQTIAEALRNSGSDYLAERAADVAEVVRRIRFALAGVEPAGLGEMATPSVVVAAMLSASDTAAMDPGKVLGFVTEGGGPTGHVAVIARSLGIPAAVGVADATFALADAGSVVVDGATGTVIGDPDEATASEYAAKAEARAQAVAAAQAYAGRRVAFGDSPMSIAANVGNPADVEQAASQRADGIGLYRTEFLFLNTPDAPTEERQVAVYTQALESFEDPVVIRTFDIGGDKPASYLDLPPEANPFLGVRGMRLYSGQKHLALAQARALLRAAVSGELWVMAPMVATVADATAVRELFDEARTSLEAEGMPFGEVKLGAMVEVPAAALTASSIAEHVDFFSIGTNDLTQYTMAADRTSAALAGYLDAAEPAVLRLCAATAEAARAAGISVSVCGEAASDPGLAVLFAAMGMDKLSVAPTAVNLVKQSVNEADHAQGRALLERCLSAPDSAAVREILAEELDL